MNSLKKPLSSSVLKAVKNTLFETQRTIEIVKLFLSVVYTILYIIMIDQLERAFRKIFSYLGHRL